MREVLQRQEFLDRLPKELVDNEFFQALQDYFYNNETRNFDFLLRLFDYDIKFPNHRNNNNEKYKDLKQFTNNFVFSDMRSLKLILNHELVDDPFSVNFQDYFLRAPGFIQRCKNHFKKHNLDITLQDLTCRIK